jgi:hypothetical protein
MQLRIIYEMEVWCSHRRSLQYRHVNITGGRGLNIYYFEISHVRFSWALSVSLYEGVSKSFRTGRLDRELQMV